MNNQELSLLGFLAEAVLAAPSPRKFGQMEAQMNEHLPEDQTGAFKAAVKVVRRVAGRVSLVSSEEGRRRTLRGEIRTLSQGGAVQKSVSEALEWAALNWNRKKNTESRSDTI
ncbi:MAG: hypothetical protein HYW49_03585 [Deltaproteobacteria bacterium]|nr:hypothetical protein [Deltaproteobacteria bacterium]